MDRELIQQIRRAGALRSDFRELGDSEGAGVLVLVAQKFVTDRRSIWWWDSLAVDSVRIDYGESDGVELLKQLIPQRGMVYLVASDESELPWVVFELQGGGVADIVNGSRYFEFFVVAKEGEWAVFDSHHNSLHAVGEIRERAAKLIESMAEDMRRG